MKKPTSHPTKRGSLAPKTPKVPSDGAAKPPLASLLTQSTPTLAALVDTYGAADAWLVRLIFLAADSNQMLQMGQEIETEAILHSVPRFVVSVMALWEGLSVADRALVVGFSPRQVPVLLAEARSLSEVNDRYDTQAKAEGLSKNRRRVDARAAFSAARSFRDQVAHALQNHIPQGSPDATTLDDIKGGARDQAHLASGLRALALTLAKLHKSADANTMTYFREIGLGAPTLEYLNQLAEDALLTGRAVAEVGSSQRVSQRDLDTQDGKVLHVVGLIYSAFRAARPKIPGLLAPELGAMIRVFESRNAPSSKASNHPVGN